MKAAEGNPEEMIVWARAKHIMKGILAVAVGATISLKHQKASSHIHRNVNIKDQDLK